MLVRDIDFCGASPAVSLWASWKDTYKYIMLRLNVNTSRRSSGNLVPFMATLGVYCPSFEQQATYARIAAFAGHLPLVERLIETASGQDIFERPDLVRVLFPFLRNQLTNRQSIFLKQLTKKAVQTRNEVMLKTLVEEHFAYYVVGPTPLWMRVLPLVLKWRWKRMADQIIDLAINPDAEKEPEKDKKPKEESLLLKRKLNDCPDGFKSLIWASKHGWLDIAKKLVGAGVTVSPIQFHRGKKMKRIGETPLMAATGGGHVAIVAWLLEQPGVSVDQLDYSGGSALSKAATCMRLESRAPMVRLLLDAGAMVQNSFLAYREGGESVLHYALRLRGKGFWNLNDEDVREEDEEVVELVTMLVKSYGATMGLYELQQAAYYGGPKVLEVLVREGGASVNYSDHNGLTPLMSAVEAKDKPIVSMLLSLGADVSVKDAWGYSATGFALYNEDLEMVQVIIDAARLQSPSELQRCLYAAFMELPNTPAATVVPLMKLLLEAGLNPDRIPETPHLLACLLFQPSSIEAAEEGEDYLASYLQLYEFLFANSKVDPNTTGYKGKTVLHHLLDHYWASTSKFPWDFIKVLVDNGANINLKDENGYSPLSIAKRDWHSKLRGETLEKMAAEKKSKIKAGSKRKEEKQ